MNVFIMEFLEAADQVIDNADEEGCSDDLTVTSKSAVEKLKKVVDDYRQHECELANLIARDILGIPTLQPQNSDSLDFHDCGVVGIREAIIEGLRTDL